VFVCEAEGGIRDWSVTGVQTCALPIYAIVRRPFVDYQFFEMCQRIPAAWRTDHRWRQRWLASTYPEYFARIPNQQTGVPVHASQIGRASCRERREKSGGAGGRNKAYDR